MYECRRRGPSSGQRELQAEAEILSSGRITARRQQRRIGLSVVVKAHGQQTRQGVIGRERQLEGRIAAAGRTRHRGYVTADGGLLAVRQIETQIERSVESAAAAV